MEIAAMSVLIKTIVNDTPGHTGFVKDWKANSMAATIVQMMNAGVDYKKDYKRLENYVWNCLSMEGCNTKTIEAVAKAIHKSL
jgi:hypothetical protein